MEAYMGPALFAITLEAMKSDVDEVALQGKLSDANAIFPPIPIQVDGFSHSSTFHKST